MSVEQIAEIETRKIGKKILQNQRAKDVLTKDFLTEQIIKQGKTINIVAAENNFSTVTVRKIAKELEVYNKRCAKLPVTLEYLTTEYVEKQRTIKDLSQDLNISSVTLIKKIKKLGLKVNECIRLTEEQKLNLRFDNLTPLHRHLTSKGERVFDNYIFRCSCGKVESIDWKAVLDGRRETCGKCSWYEDITTQHWTNIRKCADVRDLEFNLTKKYVWDLYIKQERKCILSGLPIIFSVRCKTTASVDRIDNDKGYIQGNIQLVHKSINKLRGSTDVELFKYLCTLVANNSNIDISQFENKKLIQVKNTTKCIDIDEE